MAHRKIRHYGTCKAECHDRRSCIAITSIHPTATTTTLHEIDTNVHDPLLTEVTSFPLKTHINLQPSQIKLKEEQREKLFKADVQTGIVFEYKSRVSKAIRSSIVATSLEENFNPILALKVVLVALPAHRRGETLKRRLDLFFAGDVEGLLSELRDAASKAHSLRKTPQRAATQTGPYPPAMAALAAGCPGTAL